MPRKAFAPTDAQRYLVKVLTTTGTPIGIIAKYVTEDGGIDEKTLRKHFAAEIATGREWVIAGLGLSVIRAGLAGDWRAALAYLARFGPPGWKLTQSDSDASVTAGAGVTHIIIEGGLPRVNHFEDEDGDPVGEDDAEPAQSVN
jgi:hypothetical protein